MSDNTIRMHGPIWDCACGDGALSKTLHEVGYSTYDTDLYDRGYGVGGVDFLLADVEPYPYIVTNPPFKLATEFTHRCLKLTRRKFALLMQLSFLEGQHRYRDLFSKRLAPTRVLVFSERLTMYPSGLRTGGGSTTAYAWYIWHMQELGRRSTQVDWIPPGYFEQYGEAPVGD